MAAFAADHAGGERVAVGTTMLSLFLGRDPTPRSLQPYFVLSLLVWVVCSFVLATS